RKVFGRNAPVRLRAGRHYLTQERSEVDPRGRAPRPRGRIDTSPRGRLEQARNRSGERRKVGSEFTERDTHKPAHSRATCPLRRDSQRRGMASNHRPQDARTSTGSYRRTATEGPAGGLSIGGPSPLREVRRENVRGHAPQLPAPLSV